MRYILVSACLMGTCCRYDGRTNGCDGVLSLMEREDVCLIPVCPEQLGGLPTPRIPSERRGETVVSKDGADVTAQFIRGAEEALRIARLYGCTIAILKERSPSCGTGTIYDGTFTGTLTEGDGVTAQLLRQNGIFTCGESRVQEIAASLQ